jgi:hypothetical protein
MTDLSPAALAVRLAAICAGPELEGRLAAAFRAAAAIPSASAPVPFTYKLLDIADELEANE